MSGFAVLLIAACWLGGLKVEALHVALLYFAPALVLISLLIGERYPGERQLEKWITRAGGRRRPRPSLVVRRPKPYREAAPQGGLLVALGLAVRGPPLSRWF